METVLGRMQNYWVTVQCEYSTDVMFKRVSDLKELHPRLMSHGTLCFGAREVLGFLGKQLNGTFRGEQVSDPTDRFKRRLPGLKMNWIKMHDKAGSVLRVEMVINDPTAFKVREQVVRDGAHVAEWVEMRKGVANLFRHRDVSCSANGRYLDALAVVDDPTPAIRDLDRVTQRKRTRQGQSVRAFNPLAREDHELFQASASGGHQIRGFTNQDIQGKLAQSAAAGQENHDRPATLRQGLPLIPPPARLPPHRQGATIPALAADQERATRRLQHHPTQRADIL
jgi:hypothetical protein